MLHCEGGSYRYRLEDLGVILQDCIMFFMHSGIMEIGQTFASEFFLVHKQQKHAESLQRQLFMHMVFDIMAAALTSAATPVVIYGLCGWRVAREAREKQSQESTYKSKRNKAGD